MRRILLITIVALCWSVCSLAGDVSKYDAGGVLDIDYRQPEPLVGIEKKEKL